MDIDQVKRVFESKGFVQTRENPESIVEFRSNENGEYVYLKKDQLRSGYIRIVLHPKFGSVYRALVGDERDIPWNRSSNLYQFPERVHTGKSPIHYGLSVEMYSEEALAAFLADFQFPKF